MKEETRMMQEPSVEFPRVALCWITPDADLLIARIARVSNPANEGNDATAERLIRYMIRHKHWSPFEMASMCLEIVTTRDIARQLLRHRSFSFQEFSQRYAEVDSLPPAPLREARLQDTKNRQNSLETDDDALHREWERRQSEVMTIAKRHYEWAILNGIAKEVARAQLPEGLTTSRLYMAGTIRSWLHFCGLRRGVETQKETRLIAEKAWAQLAFSTPLVAAAWEGQHAG
jgi:thymidylate synthase (FAD)